VFFEERSTVINLTTDHEPRVISPLVLLELVDFDDPVNTVICHLDLLGVLGGSLFGLHAFNLVTPLSVGEIASGLFDAFHPAARHQCRLSWVLEAKCAVFLVNRYPKPWVVHHPEYIPIHVSWLNTHRLVHGAHYYVACVLQFSSRYVEFPKTPTETGLAPIHV